MALYNLARCYVANTPGTGNITVGARVVPWITFTDAGVLTGTVSYAVEDYQIGVTGRIPVSSECGTATYSSVTGILSGRTVTNSSNSNALVNLSSNAEVYITALAADFPSSSALVVGSTTISAGTSTRILYDNAGILGEYTLTGSGTVVAMQLSPSFTTPALGVATATSINGNTWTTGTGTLTLGASKVATISNTLTFTGTDGSSVAFGTGGTVLYGNQSITLSGDVSGSGTTAITTTLATVNSNVGSFGSATQTGTFTVNGKGLTTAASNVTITPAVGSITGLGTGVATALGVNIGSAGAFVTFNGAGGTPSSMVGTNITGTAAGLTAGNVTTNANLTGDVTSVGNATTLATVNSNVGTFGSATQSVQFTVNGKGLMTAAANVTVTPAVGSITGLGTGVATALAINVGSAGAFVTFNGALGTPSSGTATNLTGLPVGTGISGLGTGVATALAVNVGSAGAFVTFNGALGTPSSGTATNITGLPLSTGVTGVLAISKGGNGGGPTGRIGLWLTAVNANSANTDNAVTVGLPSPYTKYQVTVLRLYNPSTSMTTATAGLFTSTGGGGFAITANAAISGLTTNSVETAGAVLNMTILGTTAYFTSATLQLRIGTAQGAPATFDAYVEIIPLA